MVILIAGTLLFGSCKKLDAPAKGSDSVAVFDNLWQTIDSRYAMFSYKNVDWNKIYTQYRPLVSAHMDEQELFTICTAMLDSLRDGHISLISKSNRYAYNGYYLPFTGNFNFSQLKSRYLKNATTQGILTYTSFDKTGYLYIPSFDKQLKTGDMDNALRALAPLDALIIDLRDNTGGESALVDYITSRFLTERKMVKFDIYKKGTGHDDFFEPVAKYLSPVQSPFSNKKIVVLTNKKCFSSCNDFVHVFIVECGDHRRANRWGRGYSF